MENQHYDLAEAEFSKEGKIILWCFASFFFLTGLFILFRVYVLGNKDVIASLSLVPFGISIIVSIIAYYATAKRKDLYFSIETDKIEFRFGIFKPKVRLYNWVDIIEVIVPSKQKKVMLIFKDGGYTIINLNWIEKKKSINIIKHIYKMALEKNIKIIKVKILDNEKHAPKA
jgi:hypothetical protein